MIGEDRLIKFSGVAKGEACTIVLRGARARARRGGALAPRRALRARVHGEGLSRRAPRRRVPGDDHVQGCGRTRGEDPGKTLARDGGFREGAARHPDDHLRKRGSRLAEIVSQLRASHAEASDAWASTSSPGRRATWASAGSRSVTGQAADPLRHGGGGDDHPRRRHHQVRPEAARALETKTREGEAGMKRGRPRLFARRRCERLHSFDDRARRERIRCAEGEGPPSRDRLFSMIFFNTTPEVLRTSPSLVASSRLASAAARFLDHVRLASFADVARAAALAHGRVRAGCSALARAPRESASSPRRAAARAAFATSRWSSGDTLQGVVLTCVTFGLWIVAGVASVALFALAPVIAPAHAVHVRGAIAADWPSRSCTPPRSTSASTTTPRASRLAPRTDGNSSSRCVDADRPFDPHRAAILDTTSVSLLPRPL